MDTSFEMISQFVTQRMLLRIFEEDENLTLLTEEAINRLAEPNAMLWELRVRLWKLIEDRSAKIKAFGQCEPLRVAEIVNGICSENRLKLITDNKFKCEFLSRPIRSYENSAEDLVRAAQQRIWEVLSLPIKDEKGVPDKSLTKIVFDCAKMVIDRKYGQALQKTELYAKVQSKSLHVTGQLPDNPKAIDDEIKRLEEILDVTAEDNAVERLSDQDAKTEETSSGDGGKG